MQCQEYSGIPSDGWTTKAKDPRLNMTTYIRECPILFCRKILTSPRALTVHMRKYHPFIKMHRLDRINEQSLVKRTSQQPNYTEPRQKKNESRRNNRMKKYEEQSLDELKRVWNRYIHQRGWREAQYAYENEPEPYLKWQSKIRGLLD